MLNTRNHPRAARQVLAAIGHLTWTTIIVVGAPIALARFFGWPLPGRMPDWGEVLSTTLQLVDPIVILNLFVCIAWICWAIVMAYVALDIADAVRGVGQRLHRIGPFGTIAAKLVGSVVLLVSLARPIPSLAAAAPPTPIVQMIDAPSSVIPVSQAEGLLRGTLLSDVAADAAPMAPAQPVYVVQRGDNLWAIAETHLGSGFRWTEIHDLNRDFIADPNLICTGWQLTLPADANLPTAPPPVVEEPAAPVPQPEQAAPPTTPDSAPPTTQTTTTPTAESPSTTAAEIPAAADPTETPTPQPGPTGDSALVPVTTASDEPSGLLPSLVTFVPGISGATVLATSLLLLLRRVRRRHATQGTGARRPVPPLERALVAAADVPLVRWAGQELAMLGEQLAGRRIDANPVAVEFSEAAGLELLWDRPFPDAPAPWEAVPGGWAWRLLYDPEESVPHPERSALIAGLVTFGHRDGRQLLLDLEAFGSLSVTGDDNAVHSFVRALLLELGSGDEVADVYVAVDQGAIALPSAEHLPRLQVLEPSEVRQRLAAASASTAKALAQIGSASTFAYRIYDTPVLPLEVIVTITETSDPDDTAALVASSPPRCGVAAILLGHAPEAGAHLHIGADGSARLEPLGVTFQTTSITAETETAVADLLADLPVPVAVDEEEPVVEEAATVRFVDTDSSDTAADQRPDATSTENLAEVIDLTEAALSGAEAGSIEDESWELPAPRLLVRVLGQPELVDGPDIGRRELVVVVCMACLERPTRQSDIQEAVWGGEAVEAKTVWNIVTRARAQLGQWDGEPILGKANRPENTFRLANGVWTDLQVLRTLHDRATRVSSSEAMQLLCDALALVHGPPFDENGYEWARVNQYVLDAERLIEHSALTLVDLALEAGNVDLARYAVLQGLRGLPGNEILYRARMRIEDAAGNATAVRAAYNELLTYLGDLESVPSTDTTQLFGQLVPAARS